MNNIYLKHFNPYHDKKKGDKDKTEAKRFIERELEPPRDDNWEILSERYLANNRHKYESFNKKYESYKSAQNEFDVWKKGAAMAVMQSAKDVPLKTINKQIKGGDTLYGLIEDSIDYRMDINEFNMEFISWFSNSMDNVMKKAKEM